MFQKATNAPEAYSAESKATFQTCAEMNVEQCMEALQNASGLSPNLRSNLIVLLDRLTTKTDFYVPFQAREPDTEFVEHIAAEVANSMAQITTPLKNDAPNTPEGAAQPIQTPSRIRLPTPRKSLYPVSHQETFGTRKVRESISPSTHETIRNIKTVPSGLRRPILPLGSEGSFSSRISYENRNSRKSLQAHSVRSSIQTPRKSVSAWQENGSNLENREMTSRNSVDRTIKGSSSVNCTVAGGGTARQKNEKVTGQSGIPQKSVTSRTSAAGFKTNGIGTGVKRSDERAINMPISARAKGSEKRRTLRLAPTNGPSSWVSPRVEEGRRVATPCGTTRGTQNEKSFFRAELTNGEESTISNDVLDDISQEVISSSVEYGGGDPLSESYSTQNTRREDVDPAVVPSFAGECDGNERREGKSSITSCWLVKDEQNVSAGNSFRDGILPNDAKQNKSTAATRCSYNSSHDVVKKYGQSGVSRPLREIHVGNRKHELDKEEDYRPRDPPLPTRMDDVLLCHCGDVDEHMARGKAELRGAVLKEMRSQELEERQSCGEMRSQELEEPSVPIWRSLSSARRKQHESRPSRRRKGEQSTQEHTKRNMCILQGVLQEYRHIF